MALLKLQYNYCVICGVHTGTEPYLCNHCVEDNAEPPVQYRFDQAYHCTYCGKTLDRYYDFFVDGTFKSEDYRCIGCDAVAERQHFDHRKYQDSAIRYMNAMTESPETPGHVRQAYERQRRTMLGLEHLCVD
jgi:hypothetical protein